jgi:thioredoxin 1
MIWKIVIAVLLGAGIGGLLGLWGKARGGTCPFFCHPLGGILLGAVLGGMTGTTLASRPRGKDLLVHIPTIATVQDFEAKVLKSPTPVLVDFFATWCGPCHELEPTIADLEARYRGRVAFFRVDVDQAKELAQTYGAPPVPTVIVFRRGAVVARVVGLSPEQDYVAPLDKALGEPG